MSFETKLKIFSFQEVISKEVVRTLLFFRVKVFS